MYTGRVQGVGFRYTTTRVARGFAVGGYVMNLPDGRVELVAEGAADTARDFVAEVAVALGRYITDAKQHAGSATGEFGDPTDPGSFQVRY